MIKRSFELARNEAIEARADELRGRESRLAPRAVRQPVVQPSTITGTVERWPICWYGWAALPERPTRPEVGA
jgi:hypothetical protein